LFVFLRLAEGGHEKMKKLKIYNDYIKQLYQK